MLKQEKLVETLNENKVIAWFRNNKNLLVKSFLFVYIFGLLAHAYSFFNLSLSHDVLGEFRLFSSHKVALGRFLQPVVRYILGEAIFLPWVEGFVSLFLIACSVFLVCKSFNWEKTKSIAIISGVFVTNVTVISLTASFAHDLSSDMLALYLSVLAFNFYVRNKDNFSFKKAIILLLIVVGVSSLYQAYFAVTISLIFIYTFTCLLKGCLFKDEIKRVLICFATLLVGLLFYLLISFIVSKAINMPLYGESAYNSLSSLNSPLDFFNRIPKAYENFFRAFFLPYSNIPKSSFLIFAVLICLLNISLFILSFIIVVLIIKKEKIRIGNIIFMSILFGMLPIAMNCIFILSGVSHVLVVFSYVTYYVFVIEIFKIAKEKLSIFKLNNLIKILSFSLFFIIASNIQLANACYVKKDVEEQATLALVTRIVSRIEENSSYMPGETEVVFIGTFKDLLKDIPLTTDRNFDVDFVSSITGMKSNSSITYFLTIKPYFDFVLKYEINIGSETTVLEYEQMEDVKNMPSFPNKDSIKEIDGRLVVKLN